MTGEQQTSRTLVAAGIVVLVAVPLGAMWVLSPSRAPLHEEGPSSPSAAPAASPPKGIHCEGISPSTFIVEPGGKQLLTARFSTGSGHVAFKWSATGGTLLSGADERPVPSIDGYAYFDDFEKGTLNEDLWQTTPSKLATADQKDGALRLRVPPGGHEDVSARIESKFALTGDFAVVLTVRAISATSNRGAAPLTLISKDSHETHIQALAGPAFLGIEANSRNPDGKWRSSTNAIYQGVVLLKLYRTGATMASEFNSGFGFAPLGTFTDVSSEPSTVRLEAWSLDEHPAVEAQLDNFAAVSNTVVSWQAPKDAGAGSKYQVRILDQCEATAVIRASSP